MRRWKAGSKHRDQACQYSMDIVVLALLLKTVMRPTYPPSRRVTLLPRPPSGWHHGGTGRAAEARRAERPVPPIHASTPSEHPPRSNAIDTPATTYLERSGQLPPQHPPLHRLGGRRGTGHMQHVEHWLNINLCWHTGPDENMAESL